MLKRFAKARSGLAALEFAIMLPLLVLGFLGATEVSSTVQVSQKVSQTASTAADLVAQSSTITNSDITNIFAAASAISFPYSTSGETIVISSLVDAGSGNGKVAWSDAQNGNARTVGQVVTLPTGVMTSGASVILAEVKYSFTPATTYVINTAVQLRSQFYSRPRRVTVIQRVAS